MTFDAVALDCFGTKFEGSENCTETEHLLFEIEQFSKTGKLQNAVY